MRFGEAAGVHPPLQGRRHEGEQGGQAPTLEKITLEILAMVWKLPVNSCQWKYSGEQFMCTVQWYFN